MLTNEEIEKLYDSTWDNLNDDEHIYIEFARAIEAIVRERTIDECVAECIAECLIGQWDDDFDVGYNKAARVCHNKILALKEKK